MLTLKIGQRDDLSGEQLKELLDGTLDVIRRRLSSVVNPTPDRDQAGHGAIRKPALPRAARDFSAAQRTVLALHRGGHLGESALLKIRQGAQIRGIDRLARRRCPACRLSILDRLIAGDRYDPILILGRVLNLGWPTVRALILMWYGPNRTPADADLEQARVNFTRLMPTTAERVVKFWRNRQSDLI